MADNVNQAGDRVGRYRYVIVALLFFACTINYIDRQMISVLKPTVFVGDKSELKWTETNYSDVVFWFQIAYAASYLVFGKVVDALGSRLGYAIAILIWTISHTAHGLATSVSQFIIVRMGLGMGEAGNFPGGVKAVTEWFPQKERSFAIGLFNAGSNVGSIATPLILALIIETWGFDWRMAFYLTGFFGIALLLAWWSIYRHPDEKPQVSAAERAYIQQDNVAETGKIGWGAVFKRRETWAYALGKFFIDPIWWFFIFWLPGYLSKQYGLDLKASAIPLAAIYLLSDAGSISGGWLSSYLIKHGKSVNFARKLTMLICALAIAPIFFAQSVTSVTGAVLLIGLATAGHQAFSANLYTIPSDMFPQAAVGSVIGIGGAIGALGGAFMAKFIGYILDTTGNYSLIFAIAASAYFIALAAIHILSPRLERVSISETA